jgi:hypothetical protein
MLKQVQHDGGLNGAPASDEIPDQHDDADHEQQVNEASGNVKCEEAEGPQDQQDNRDRQKHGFSSIGVARVTVDWRARSNAAD